MQCDKIYLTLLTGHIDGTNSDVEEKRLQQHLKSCKHCRELLEIMEGNDALLAQSIVAPPEDLTARIMDAVRKEPKKRNNRKRFYFSTAVAGLAVAAMLCFALMGDNLPLLPDVKEDDAELTVYAPLEQDSSSKENYDDPVGTDPAGSDSHVTEGPHPMIPPIPTLPTTEPPATVPPTTEPPATVPPTTVPPTTVPPVQSSEPVPSSTQTVIPTETQESFTLPTLDITGDGKEDGQSITGFPGRDPNSRNPFTGRYESSRSVPTLVIWGATVQDIRLPFSAVKSEFSAKTSSSVNSSLYDYLASALFNLCQPIFSSSDGTTFLTPAYDAELYTVPYEDLRNLFESCSGKYELAVYFPKDLEYVTDCKIILIGSPKGEEKIPGKFALE